MLQTTATFSRGFPRSPILSQGLPERQSAAVDLRCARRSRSKGAISRARPAHYDIGPAPHRAR
jgi:hypothetical protein